MWSNNALNNSSEITRISARRASCIRTNFCVRFRWAARGRSKERAQQGVLFCARAFQSPTKSPGYPSLHQVSSVTPLLRWRTSASSCGKSTHRLAPSGGSADGHWLCRPSTRGMGVTGPTYPGPILEVCPFRNTPRINPFHSDENCRKGRVT